MGHKNNRLRTTTAGEPPNDVARTHPTQGNESRPRLGAPDDPWSTVFKDVIREAPKTALLVSGSVMLSLVGLVVQLVSAVVSLRASAYQPLDPSAAYLVRVLLDEAWRIIMRGG